MSAFNRAWTLLKQRGFETDPRYEDERLQALEQGFDKRDLLQDELRRVNDKILIGGLFGPVPQELHSRRDDLENELYHLMESPEGLRYGAPPPMNMLAAQTGPMFQEQQIQEAEGIEAEGIELPDVPSSAPPADIGRAGSLAPEPYRPDLEQLRQSMTPLAQALARVRAGSGPQPLQFDRQL